MPNQDNRNSSDVGAAPLHRALPRAPLNALAELNIAQLSALLQKIGNREFVTISDPLKADFQADGLIEVISAMHYRDSKPEVNLLPLLEEKWYEDERRLAKAEEAYKVLSVKLNSKWHRAWSRESTLQNEERELSKSELVIKALRKERDSTKSRANAIFETSNKLERFFQMGQEYVALTDRGAVLLRALELLCLDQPDISYKKVPASLIDEINAPRITTAGCPPAQRKPAAERDQRTAPATFYPPLSGNSRQRSTSSSSGFSLKGAIIGDALDDGVVNGSSGFVAGGIIGALIDD